MPKVKDLSKVMDERDYYEFIVNRDNPFYFEKFCGACDFFENEKECPFYGKVMADTMWESETHIVEGVKKKCDKFCD